MYQKVVCITTITYIDLQPLVQKNQLILNNCSIDVDYEDDQEDILGPNHLVVGRQLLTTSISTQN